jgi:hypothetical protein
MYLLLLILRCTNSHKSLQLKKSELEAKINVFSTTYIERIYKSWFGLISYCFPWLDLREKEGITAACLLHTNLSSFLRTLENKLGIREFIQLTTPPEISNCLFVCLNRYFALHSFHFHSSCKRV